MSRHHILLTITPGRSGSVFLADVLARSFPWATVTHERLGPAATFPRFFFHAYDDPRLSELERHPPVARFLDALEKDAERAPVVEIGMFTSHLTPVLVKRFPGQLRLLALFRDPVSTAASHAVRGMYQPWPRWSLFHMANVTPFDPGMGEIAFQHRWSQMTPFERNLYCWLQYANLWREIERRYADVPKLMVKSEGLFADPGRWSGRVAAFAGLEGPIVTGSAGRNELGKSARMHGVGDHWRRFSRHPEVIAAAAAMGYRLTEQDLSARMEKYRGDATLSDAVLRTIGYFHATTYIRRLTSRRFWKQYRHVRRLHAQYPQYFTR